MRMSFLRSRKSRGPKPISSSKYGNGNAADVSSNGRIVIPFQNSTSSNSNAKQCISMPHSNSDLPSGRKMIVLQEYQPDAEDTKGIFVRRGETVMVLSQDENRAHIRNEQDKEGYVPCTHLVAPYSTMRSRTKYSTGGPLRHVASGSNIEGMEPSRTSGSPQVVPMYKSKSGGKPRNYSTPESNRQRSNTSSSSSRLTPRRVCSPHDYGHNTMPAALQGQNSANSTYDQKYSPSTSSGVASLTGTSSPVVQSDCGSNHSSLCSIGEERGRAAPAEGAPVQNGINENIRESSRIRGRAASEMNISYAKHNRSRVPLPQSSDQIPHPLPEVLPPFSDDPHTQEDGVFYNSVNDDIPPPLPPRTLYYNLNPPPPQLASQGDLYIPPSEEYPSSLDEWNPYAAPADAICRTQSPHLVGQPRGRWNDMKVRDVTSSQDNGVYSEVFQGNQRPLRYQNECHVSPNRGVDDECSGRLSNGGSFRSRSSRQSSSCVSSLHNQMPEPYCNSHEVIISHVADVTLDSGGEVKDGCISKPPGSANSLTHSSSALIKKFRKNLWGLCIVTETFQSYDENEVSVQEGDHISVWNQDDPEWYWIVKHDTNEEGFVPSGCLKEIVSDNQSVANQSMEITHSQQFSDQPTPSSSSKPPPLPPKELQRYPKPPLHPKSNPSAYDNHVLKRSRDRATTHNVRSSPVTTRHSSGSNGTGFRGQLNSDGSVPLSMSPPNTPPPPYTKYDQNQAPHHNHTFHQTPPPLPQNSPAVTSRHFSLSQHADVSHSNFSTHMQRTKSHGHTPYRRVHIPHSSEIDGGGVINEGGAVERVTSTPEVFVEVDGGTLV